MQAKVKAKGAAQPLVVTANRLRDGRVVWLAEGGRWSERVAEARVFARRGGRGRAGDRGGSRATPIYCGTVCGRSDDRCGRPGAAARARKIPRRWAEHRSRRARRLTAWSGTTRMDAIESQLTLPSRPARAPGSTITTSMTANFSATASPNSAARWSGAWRAR